MQVSVQVQPERDAFDAADTRVQVLQMAAQRLEILALAARQDLVLQAAQPGALGRQRFQPLAEQFHQLDILLNIARAG